MAVADRKLKAVRTILNNDVYLPESCFYQRLEVVLHRLPAEVLDDLALVVACRSVESREQGRVLERMIGDK